MLSGYVTDVLYPGMPNSATQPWTSLRAWQKSSLETPGGVRGWDYSAPNLSADEAFNGLEHLAPQVSSSAIVWVYKE